MQAETPGRWKRWMRRIGALAAILLLIACEAEKVAGTSTSVGDTMDGVAILADGRGAAGARIYARAHEIDYRDGKPEGLLLDSAVADARGHFRLDDSATAGSYYLEIIHPEAVYFDERTGSTAGGEFRLSRAGALRITANWKVASDSTAWVGVRGTAHFMQVRKPLDGGMSIAMLDGLAPGSLELVTFADESSNERVKPVRIESGLVTDQSFTVE